MQKKNAILFIFVTLLIDTMGIGIIIPVLPKLITGMMHCSLEYATIISGYMGFLYAFMQFFFSPLLGAMSDRFGRRSVLLISLFGFGVDYLLLGFAKTVVILFIGRIIAGITGASFTVAGAYIADISPPEKRAQNFGVIGAAFGLGFIAGPALGGALAHFGERVPFFAAAALSLINWLYGFFILPESLKPENRRKFEWKRANPLGALVQMKKHPLVLRMAVVFFLVNLAGQSLPNTWSFYTIHRYGWTSAQVGLSLAYVGVLIAIVQGGLTRILIPRFGEKRAIYFGLMLNITGMLGIALAVSPMYLFIATVPLAFGGLAGPSMQSILSLQIPANEQGELQGFMNSVMSITAILGPILMTRLFSTFSMGFHGWVIPGAQFFCSGLLSLAGLIYAFMILRNYQGRKSAA